MTLALQVCNLADCIKVAADFVSPENVQRCAQLTQEFRILSSSHMPKEDILQLQMMVWHAWGGLCDWENDAYHAHC